MLTDLRRRLRPMGFADILDEAVDLYRRNFLLLFGIGAVLYLPLSVLMTSVGIDRQSAFSTDTAAVAEAGFQFAVLMLVLGIEMVLITGAMTFATAEVYLERKTSVWECYKKVLNPATLFSFVWANLLFLFIFGLSFVPPVALLIAAAVTFGASGGGAQIFLGALLLLTGLAAFVIPAYTGARLAAYTPAFFVEGKGAGRALARSWHLLKGRAARTFGIIVVVAAVTTIIQLIALSPFSFIIARDEFAGRGSSAALLALNTLIRSGLEALLAPVNAMVVILIYYDARIRKEGFDLEMLAADLDRKPRQAAPWERVPPPEEQLPGSHHTSQEPPR